MAIDVEVGTDIMYIRNIKRHTNSVGTKFGDGGKQGQAKIPSPQPPSFLPARAFSFSSAARSAAIILDFVQNEFQLFPANITKFSSAGQTELGPRLKKSLLLIYKHDSTGSARYFKDGV